MKKEFRDKWVAALRSGEYKQAESSLYDAETGRYCCLGVACLLLGYKPRKFTDETALEMSFDGDSFDGRVYPTPKKLAEIGIRESTALRLAYMNDAGMNFSEIADHIARLSVSK